MRKFLVLCLTAAMLLAALALPPLSGASRIDKPAKRAPSVTAKKPVQADGNPLMYRAVNFGESRPVSELAAEQRVLSSREMKRVQIKDREAALEEKREQNAGGKEDRDRDGVEVEREKNNRNAERVKKIDPDAKATRDEAIAQVPGGKGGLAPQVLPTPTVSFETISLTDTTALPGQGFLPPDINGEIGPNHFVQTVNVAFRIYNRTGTPLIPLTSIGTLFGTIPGPCANNEDGDPIVMYDQMADRWLISEFCVSVANPNNHQLIAISKTGDPTGAYYLYDFMLPNNKFNDYPHFGVWSDGYYMTNNQFTAGGVLPFLGAGVYAFDRAKMIAGDPTASYIYFDKAEGCPAACQFGGMLPTDLDGFTPPPAGAPASIMQFDDDQTGGAADQLRIFDFHADFATPANSTLTERTGSPLAVATFDSREVPAGSRNIVPQPGGAALDVISDRLMFRLAYRNFGDHESIVATHSVNAAVNPAFRSGARYYEIRRTNPAAAWAVQEQATMAGAAGDTTHRWMGSTALNGSGSQAVAYSASSTTVFPSIRYAGRLSGDPAGSLAQGEQTLVAGTSSQTHSSGRWGDYTDLTVDPVDDCTFWYAGEYITGAASPDNTRWHTRVGAFQFGPCAPVQKGILSGTITSSAGGAPIPNATVQAGPFIRNSNLTGNYNIDPMGTGTYTLTVSAPGYTTANVPGVTITQGGTTTQNVQLTPQNVLQGGTPVITAESCAPPNLALDPGETVTVNLPIVNNGGAGATTSNLVATLQATGGVSSPSGPQTYGVVAQGAPAVVKSFTFTVSATCGQVANVTLQLQDGATNYGTVVYNMQVGTLGAGSPLTISTGNITTAIPDVSSVDIPLPNISQTGAVGDVNVKVRLNHTFDGDITLALVAPDNTVVTLADRRSNPNDGGDNYGTGTNDCAGTPTIFDDAAANSISTGAPPFAGTFKPETPLAALNGKTITGIWKLRITDSAALDTGTVGCVTLEFIRQPFLCCGVSGTPLMGSGGNATITSESIAPSNNAPDPGETVTATFPLVNTGDGNTSNLVATLQASGGVTPITPTATYGVVTAGGPAASQPLTFVASGTCGSNITATLQLQDGAINLGTAIYTFRLGTTSTSSQTFSNATAIVIPATGTGTATGAPSNPYPSAITVAGVTAPVTKVTVTLKQISHTFPSDVDVLLVGPTGIKFTLMSDVIGGTDWTGQTYTFDDDAAGLLPSSGTPPASGTFKPTNYGTGDAYPAPAPAAPYLDPATAGTATLASAFNSLNPNGTWNLYVVDDAGTDIGQFAGGWDLTLGSTQSICNAQTCSLTCPANITVPADASGTGAVVNYPAANVTGACGVPNYSIPSGSTFPVGTTQVNVTGANAAACSFNVTVTGANPPLASTSLAISEFRESGPAGPLDEYIEVVNMGNAPFTVNASDASAGWSVAALNAAGTVATLVATIPNGTVIPARGHYLIANSTAGLGYSLSNYGGAGNATPDATYTADIPDNVGIALFNTANVANLAGATRIDAVNFTTQAGALAGLFTEGTRLTSPTLVLAQAAYVRKLTTGVAQDTGDNAADFDLVSPTGATFGAAQSILGAPGPENLASPIQRNATIKAGLIDPTQASTAPPNRIRDTTPGTGPTAQGTLDIRRSFKNTTGAPVTRLRFRVVDVTTLNTPNPGGQQADMRLLTSPDTTANGGTITIIGTTLESPSAAASGGGLNATGVVAIPGGALAPNASINVRFLLGVASGGRFRFFVNVEALP